MAGYNIGEAFVQITPSFDDVARRIDRYFKGKKATLGVDLDTDDLSQAVARAAGKIDQKLKVKVTPELDRAATKTVTDQLNKIPAAARKVKVTPEVDTKQIDRDLDNLFRGADQKLKIVADADLTEALRKIGQLESLSPHVEVTAELNDAAATRALSNLYTGADKRLTVVADADVTAALAKLDQLDSHDQHVTVTADADTGAAKAKLRELDAERRRVDKQRANVTVDASSASRGIGIMALLGAAVAGVGAAAPAAAAGIAAIGAASVGLTGIVGTLFAAFNGVGEAVEAMQAVDDAAIGKASSNAKQRVTQANAVADSQRAVADAQRGVAEAQDSADRAAVQGAQRVSDARRDVADAYARVADAQQDAARGVADAERNLADAQRSSRDAQAALTRARAEAREAIEDLRLSLRGAALDEEAASIALERAQQELAEERAQGAQRSLDTREAELRVQQTQLALDEAREKLAKVKSSGVTGLALSEAELRVSNATLDVDQARATLAEARSNKGTLDLREAELAAKRAALALDEARDRHADLRQESARAARTGVEGDERVVAAHQQVNDATRRVRDAEAALAQARKDGAREVAQAQQGVIDAQRDLGRVQQEVAWQQQDSARTVADAQRRVADAQRRVTRAMQQSASSGSSELDKLRLAMSKLTPEGQSFANFLHDEMKPALREIGADVQTATLPKMEAAFRTMIGLGPTLSTVMSDIGSALGDLAIKGADMVTSGPWRADFKTLGQSTVTVLEDLGEAGLAFGQMFMDIMVASSPVLEMIADGLRSWAQNLADVVSGARESGELTAFFEKAWNVLKRVWDVLTNVVSAVWNFATALAPLGDVLLTVLDSVANLVHWFSELPSWLSNAAIGAGLAFAAWIKLGGAIDGVAGAVVRSQKGWSTLGGRVGRMAGVVGTAQIKMLDLATGMNTAGRISRDLDAHLARVGDSAGATAEPLTRATRGATETAFGLNRAGDASRTMSTKLTSSVATSITQMNRFLPQGALVGNAMRRMSDSVAVSMLRTAERFAPVAAAFESTTSRIGRAATTAGGTIRNGLSRAVSGLAGVFGGPWGLAVTGAMVGLGFLIDHFAQADQAAEDYKADVDELTQAFETSKGVMDASILSTNNKALADAGAANGARHAGLQFQDYTRALAGNEFAMDKVRTASDSSLRALGRAAGAGRDYEDAYVGLNHALLNGSVTMDNTAGYFEKLGDKGLGATTASLKFSDSQKAALSAILNASGALGAQVRKTQEARDKYIAMEMALSGASRETVELRIAQNELHNQQEELLGSSIDLTDAELSLKEQRQATREAIQQYGNDSLEAQRAKVSEAESIKRVVEAAEDEARAHSTTSSATEKDRIGREAYRRKLAEIAEMYGKTLPDAFKDYIATMGVADASAAGFTIKVDDLGRAVAELPDGHQIVLNANPQNARNTIDTTVQYANGQTGTVTLWANKDPATGETIWWKRNADGTWGRAQLDARIDPATGKTSVWVRQSNGTWAKSNLNANIDPATGRVQAWWQDADGKRAVAVLDANTQPARTAIQRFYDWYLGTLRGMFDPKQQRERARNDSYLPLPTTGGDGGVFLFNNAEGNLVHRMQRGRLSPMAGSVARVVAPNTWRVIGDRARGDEAFIPIDNAPRSHSILDVTARRMGYALAPMDDGGILAFQDGGLATPATPAGVASPAAPTGPGALDALDTNLATVNATLGLTTAALQLVTAALDAATAAAARTAVAGVAALDQRINATLRPTLRALADEITRRSIPTLRQLQAHLGVHTVTSIGLLRTHLGHLRNALTLTADQARTQFAGMTVTTQSSVATMQGALTGLRGGLGNVRSAFAATADWVRVQWGRIRGYTRAPVVDAIKGPFNAGLIFAWNQLDQQFKLNKHVAPIPIQFAVGGSVPGTGSRDSVPAMLTPGEFVLSKRAITNLGGVDNVNRLHQLARSGTLGPEVRLGDMQDARSRQRLMRRVPLDDVPGHFAYGGVQPQVAAAGHEIEKVFGRLPGGIGGVGSRPNASDHPLGLALDFMTMSNSRLGDRIASYLMANSRRLLVKYLIWKQRINEGSGWDGMEDRGSITANHFDHVHASFLRAGQEGRAFGGELFDPVALVNQHFQQAGRRISDYLDKWRGNQQGEIGGGMAQSALQRLKDYAVRKLNETMLAGGTGSGVQRWRPVVLQALKMLRLPLGWADLTLRRMNQESGGNAKAINLWDSNAARGTPSKGLMQVIDPTFAAYRDRRLPNDVWNPLANIVASMRYATSRYGSLPAAYNRAGGYDTGGWLPPGVTASVNHTGKPEAVLTWEQWRDIHQLASQSGGGGGRTVQVFARTDASPEHIAHSVDRHLAIGTRL